MKHENNSCLHSLRVGLLINPVAGLGGALALKGSDHLPKQLITANESKAYQRVYQTLLMLQPYEQQLTFFCPSGVMGADALHAAGFDHQTVYQSATCSTAYDTQEAVAALQQQSLDLLLFAGGDGTARDICLLTPKMPVLGIPAGVKMHSGVFAVNPQDAAQVVVKLLTGGGVALEQAEVRDLDESALQQGKVQTRFYGSLQVPVDIRLIQQMKCASPDSDELLQTEIAAYVSENLEPDVLYLFGVGSTCAAIMRQLGHHHTLMGFDAVLNGDLLVSDVNAQQIAELVRQHRTRIILTVTGGQGILIGRGNQQLTLEVLRLVGREALWIVATANKLQALAGRSIRLDTGDAALNKEWQGLIAVTTGYQQQQLCYLE